jgi:hypothetical protein
LGIGVKKSAGGKCGNEGVKEGSKSLAEPLELGLSRGQWIVGIFLLVHTEIFVSGIE